MEKNITSISGRLCLFYLFEDHYMWITMKSHGDWIIVGNKLGQENWTLKAQNAQSSMRSCATIPIQRHNRHPAEQIKLTWILKWWCMDNGMAQVAHPLFWWPWPGLFHLIHRTSLPFDQLRRPDEEQKTKQPLGQNCFIWYYLRYHVRRVLYQQVCSMSFQCSNAKTTPKFVQPPIWLALKCLEWRKKEKNVSV